nr:serine/threonine-protein kinase [Micromonospora sp. DSM 115978]
FIRECRAAGRLSDHPEIATVLDAGVTGDGRPFIAMQYFPTGSLSDWVNAMGPLSTAETVMAVATVARGLRAAHTDGILHRDVKPANVLVTSAGAVVLSDFGVAGTVHGPADAASSQSAFTPQFTAPEVLNGQPYRAAADVYALGVTAHTLLTGIPPFTARPGEGPATVLQRIVAGDAPPLAEDVPEPLRALVSAMTDLDPAQRPSTEEVCAELASLSVTIGADALPVQAVAAADATAVATADATVGIDGSGGGPSALRDQSLGLEEVPTHEPQRPRPAASDAAPAPVAGDPRQRRRRRQLVVGVAAVGLLLAAAAFGLLQVLTDDTTASPPVTGPTTATSPTLPT